MTAMMLNRQLKMQNIKKEIFSLLVELKMFIPLRNGPVPAVLHQKKIVYSLKESLFVI